MSLSIDKVYVENNKIYAANVVVSVEGSAGTFEFEQVIRIQEDIAYVDAASVDTGAIIDLIEGEFDEIKSVLAVKASREKIKTRPDIVENTLPV
jgi:hypothetical protein